jgi:hypothetical protein
MGEVWGVWGAMGEGERRKFVEYLAVLGFDEIPAEPDFVLALRSYYEYRVRRSERRADRNGAGHLAGGDGSGDLAAKSSAPVDSEDHHSGR